MKRLLFLSFVLVASVFAAGLDATVKTDGDKVGSDLAAAIVSKQAAYLAANGRYFQCLSTHSEIPVDGAKTAPATDVKTDASVVSYSEQSIPLPESTSCAVAIDNYNGPSGKGYVIRLTTNQSGKIYTKRINVGPETYRTHDWK